MQLYDRVIEEDYSSAEEAAIDHLMMAHAHLFEETEGRDIDGLLSGIEKIIKKIVDN